MSDEVWWVSRDNRDQGPDGNADDGFVCTVELHTSKPEFMEIDGSLYAVGGGFIDTMHVDKFKLYSGIDVKPCEIIPIRPLRIERVEVK